MDVLSRPILLPNLSHSNIFDNVSMLTIFLHPKFSDPIFFLFIENLPLYIPFYIFYQKLAPEFHFNLINMKLICLTFIDSNVSTVISIIFC